MGFVALEIFRNEHFACATLIELAKKNLKLGIELITPEDYIIKEKLTVMKLILMLEEP